jgi:aryl-alcohol dehydrogenase-like predicted oxidoreductase
MSRLSPDDWRRKSPDFRAPDLERNLELRNSLRPIADRHRTTAAAVAVAWVLAWAGVTGAIVGARSPQQVDGWIAAADLELGADDLDEIATGIINSGAGQGPERPI